MLNSLKGHRIMPAPIYLIGVQHPSVNAKAQ